MKNTSVSTNKQGKGWRWESAPHQEINLINIMTPYPWPAEVPASAPDETMSEDLLEGIRRFLLDAEETGKEVDEDWAKLVDFIALMRKASLRLEHGDMKGLEARLNELEDLRPSTAYVANTLGFVAKTKGEKEESLQNYANATEIDPGNVQYWINYGNALYQNGEVEESGVVFEEAYKLAPHNQNVLQGLCNALLMRGIQMSMPDGTTQQHYIRYEEFAKESRRKIKAWSNKTSRDVIHNTNDLLNYTEQLNENKDYALAVEAARGLLKLDRYSTPYKHLLLAALVSNGDSEEAMELGNALLKKDPKDAEARFSMARCQYEELGLQAWHEAIVEVLEMDPNHYGAIMMTYGFADSKAPTRLLDHSRAHLECAAWAEKHSSWRAFLSASMQAVELGETERAFEWSEKAYRINPKDKMVLLHYLSLLVDIDENERTAAILKPNLAEKEDDLMLLYMYAGAMKRLGLKDEAIKTVKRGLAVKKNFHRARCSDGSEDFDFQHFLDELEGYCAQCEVKLESISEALIRPVIYQTSHLMGKAVFVMGRGLPTTEIITLEFAKPRERVLVEMVQGSFQPDFEPLSLGCFVIEDIQGDQLATNPVKLTCVADEANNLRVWANQGENKLHITWHAYAPVGVLPTYSKEAY